MPDNVPFSARIQANWFVRYGAAFSATICMLVVGRALKPWLSETALYIAASPAIAFSAWYCGLGPSVVATILALLGLMYWLIPPVHPLAVMTLMQVSAAIMFLVAAALIAAMGETRRRENEALRRGQGELEQLVRERTAKLDMANQGLRELTARLMQSQDEERRRIARELHDSIGQTLAALTMNLTTVVADIEKLAQAGKNASDSLALVQELNKEVRTVSYLLHPPLLDEAGLASALRWYAEGFSERSKIKVDLDIPENFGRLPQEMETAIFRTVQECLTNIHRHSGSPEARIHLARLAGQIQLRVEDKGAGIPAEKLDAVASAGTLGVGVRGMRERLRQLGGGLDIRSSDSGTTVEARLPLANSSQVAA